MSFATLSFAIPIMTGILSPEWMVIVFMRLFYHYVTTDIQSHTIGVAETLHIFLVTVFEPPMLSVTYVCQFMLKSRYVVILFKDLDRSDQLVLHGMFDIALRWSFSSMNII